MFTLLYNSSSHFILYVHDIFEYMCAMLWFFLCSLCHCVPWCMPKFHGWNHVGLESLFMYVRATCIHCANLFVCQMNRHVVTIDDYVDVPPNNEEQLLQAVAAQPISVGLCGSERAFQLYSKVRSLSRHDRNVKLKWPYAHCTWLTTKGIAPAHWPTWV